MLPLTGLGNLLLFFFFALSLWCQYIALLILAARCPVYCVWLHSLRAFKKKMHVPFSGNMGWPGIYRNASFSTRAEFLLLFSSKLTVAAVVDSRGSCCGSVRRGGVGCGLTAGCVLPVLCWYLRTPIQSPCITWLPLLLTQGFKPLVFICVVSGLSTRWIQPFRCPQAIALIFVVGGVVMKCI